jgi:hypothetical protein
MALHRIAAAVSLVGLLMLALPAAAQEIAPSPAISPSADFFHLNHVQGDGCSLLVPSNASVSVGANGIGIRGPEVAIEDADGNRYNGDACFLSFRVYDNPDHLSAEASATRDAQSLWNRVTAENAPTGGLPKLVNGHISPEVSAYLTLNGEPAFEVTYNACVADDRRVYPAHGDQIIFINYQDTSDYDAPLGQVQLDVYALLLSTLTFNR